jgi:hypothetical protein
MPYHWDSLRIRNYKSIKDLQLANCGKINVFIGPPNSGKSNILEALDLANLPHYVDAHFKEGPLAGFNFQKFFRVHFPEDFFYRGLSENKICIEGYLDGNAFRAFYLEAMKQSGSGPEAQFHWKNWNNDVVSIDSNFNPISPNPGYTFINETFRFTDEVGLATKPIPFGRALAAPFGLNLGSVLLRNEDLLELLEDYSSRSGFELGIDKVTNEISVQIRVKPSVVVNLPFSALSDTFRRMLFFISAVRTGIAPVLTLEEPEALSFPPYVAQLAQEIIETAASEKQFFISTHSPYLVNEFIDHVPFENLGVFVCHFSQNEKQTKVRRLSKEELSEVQNFGVDLFFNLDPYLNDPAEHSA